MRGQPRNEGGRKSDRRRTHARYAVWKGLAASLPLVLTLPARGQGDLKTYQTRYYVLHTDVDPPSVAEITRRITLMAEEYHSRTRGFAGEVRDRLPIYVYRQARDYAAAGGLAGSAGVFTGNKLMVLAGDRITAGTWHTVQHEGFHQFAHAAIGRGLPPWANEGLAEYFAEGVFTGDSFYTGLVPPARLARLRQALQERKLRRLADVMRLSPDTWNAEVQLAHAQAGTNYDQAWSMIHFLAQADHGRYQEPFARFLTAVSRGQPWEAAWVKNLDDSVDAFEKRWKEYWLGLPDDPTEGLRIEAAFATVSSFFARAFSQRQFFDDFDGFLTAARAGQLKAHADDWLPPALLDDALKNAAGTGKWSLERRSGRRTVALERPDGTVLEGDFKLSGNRVRSVDVVVRPPKKKRR